MPNLANPNNPKPAPLQRMGAQRVLVPPGPVLPEKPPLQRMAAQRVLTPAAEGDGPCSYIYIPGLARSSFVNSDLSVNPSITPRETRDGVKLIINTSPSQYVKPTDANYKKLFQTFASR